MRAKVINIEEPVKLFFLLKPEVTIADSMLGTRLTLWESDINTLQEFESYHFERVTVRSFKNEKYLSKPKDGALMMTLEMLWRMTCHKTSSLSTVQK